ncbi:hypothetical protein Q7P37_003536 [Cladosporium fusiforme]
MSSRQQSVPARTSATEELSRFARYVEFRTRNLRQAAASFLVTNEPTSSNNEEDEDINEPLFVDVGEPNDGWVGLTEEASDVPEVCILLIIPAPHPYNSGSHTTLANYQQTNAMLTELKDTSQQIYHEPAPPPPGPIQQTTVAAQRAALQALGLTGVYLELGLRLIAEDVGWMMHTASVEDAMRSLRERFPLLARLGESYGRGANAERERRLSQSQLVADEREERIFMREVLGDDGETGGEMEDVPLGNEGEGDEEWDALYGETYAVGGR